MSLYKIFFDNIFEVKGNEPKKIYLIKKKKIPEIG